ncbi:DUF2920 family protein [Clostridium baratii]|uniref:DUF2920 family protein n=1 Tax=Clostridium baratii TaxID=1561 RepID=UPI0030CAC1CB
MAIERKVILDAIPSIYSKNRNKMSRKLEAYYSIPSSGINEQTGILMYIAGFRGHSNANVFKKLRRVFADEYNLITIQCNYFGYEFMQKPKLIKPQDKHMNYFTKEELIKIYNRGKFHIEEFRKLSEKYGVKMLLREDLSNESIENFNEMGIMQASDNLNALISIINILKEDGHSFNSNKVILYGNSHGAYLAHLCNRLAPDLISVIIDNSGWLYPRHIKKDSRILKEKNGETVLNFVFDYIARDIIDDHQIIDLEYIYNGFSNKAKILSFHGEKDHLISLEDKRNFIKKLDNAELIRIGEDNLQSYKDIFKNYKHGLGADFLKLFEYLVEEYNLLSIETNNTGEIKNLYIETDLYRYIFDYSNDFPYISKCKK